LCRTSRSYFALSALADLFCSMPPLVSQGSIRPTNNSAGDAILHRAAKDSKKKSFSAVPKPPPDFWDTCLHQDVLSDNYGSDIDNDGVVSENLIEGFEKVWLLTPQARQCMPNTKIQPFPFPGEPIEAFTEEDEEDPREVEAPVVETTTEDVAIDFQNDVEIINSQLQTGTRQPSEDNPIESSKSMSNHLSRIANPPPPPKLLQHPLRRKPQQSDLAQTGWFRVVAEKGAKGRGCVDMDAGDVVCALPQGTICSFSAAQWWIPKPEHEKSLVPVVRLRANVPGVSGEAWVSLNGRNVGSEFPITEIIERRLCTSCGEEVN